MTTLTSTVRPRFTERQIDLLLAAVYIYREREGADSELVDLYRRLIDMQVELARDASNQESGRDA